MRVALVTSLLAGGPLEHTRVLAEGLLAAGHEVQVVCAAEEVSEGFRRAGAEVVTIALRSPLDLAGGRRVRAAVADADVVHAQDRRAGLWTRVLPRPRTQAQVYTVHGLPDPYLPPPAGPGSPGLRAALAYRGLDVALVRRSDAVVTPSAAMAEQLAARVGYPRDRLLIVPNGVRLGPLLPPGDAVGTLSVLDPVKGLDVFLDAAARLARDRPALRFVVAGRGPEEAALRARAARLGLGSRVTFPGYVPAGEVLARLGVLALPSLMENAPMALLEAMAAGVPVVASRVGGIPELAPPGTALLVPPRDPAALAEAVASLLDDPAARAAQRERGRERVEREGSREVMTERMLEVYARARRARVA